MHLRYSRTLAALAVLAIGSIAPVSLAQQPAAPAAPQSAKTPPLFDGMGPHRRTVTTTSPDAQKYFDQALTWTYAFNHDEAIRSYQRAAELDPNCAMAFWGVALCNGPHINVPLMDEARSKAAWDAIKQAQSLADKASPVEKALIQALAARYADPASGSLPLTFEERAPLDRAYADAMKRVHGQFPDDPDVATLYAESLMDLRPWDLWDPATGQPRPETPEILALLEMVMTAQPTNPGASHLYIHAVEASPHPEKATAAADRLRTPLVPASGHLVHMPAHIDVRTGRWAEAAEQNRRASAVDATYRQISPKQGVYRLYMAHNDHFLSYACMMLGRREEAVSAARAMLSKIPSDWVKENAPLADAYAAIEIEALLRFGRWDEVIALSKPPEFLPITTALWHFARASAFNAKGDADKASAEQAQFRAAVKAVPEDAMMAINPAHTVLSIAEHTLAGEIAFRQGDAKEAITQLRKAAEIEDSLLYMEPPDWVQPTRHALGAILIADGQFAEAEKTYREDLARWPGNGWSLFGLARALSLQNSPQAGAAKDAFNKAWASADTTIHATCLCVPEVE
ncbi:MAG: hypothetical protein KF745_00210 [Phycisphaeraceae bacterium]|nr:hypothetical protein [Phycisphaeraceae bacterium]